MDSNNNNAQQGSSLTNGNFFADTQQYHSYDDLLSYPAGQNFSEASWGVNASTAQPQSVSSRDAASSTQPWHLGVNHQSANHIPAASSAQANLDNQQPPLVRSLSRSPAPYGQQGLGGYGIPTSYQYSQPPYDPSLLGAVNYTQPSKFNYAKYSAPQQNSGTIAPQVLEHQRPIPPISNQTEGSSHVDPNRSQWGIARGPASDFVDSRSIVSAIPKGDVLGMHSVINFDQLARATNSERMAPYLSIGRQTQDWPVNRTTTLPQYVPRKSKNDLRKLAGNDPALLAKIGRKTIKKEKRDLVLIRNDIRPFKNGATAQAASPAKQTQDSSSEEESSEDDDDSSYTSDDDLESTPLPAKRPENLKDAVGYDTIKALWRSKRRSVASADLKKALVDFWEVVKTIRDRWKSDSEALKAAEEKNKIGELPLLKSRVKDQRDMIESAFRAALKHGHRSIVGLLGENVPLVFLCYQFLLDRFKQEDVNGPLSRVLLESMALFTTLTNDKLEKTHLAKVLPRVIKNGDAKTQFYAKRIIQNAAVVAKDASNEVKAVQQPIAAAVPSADKAGEPETVAGMKRAATTVAEGAMRKKVATGTVKVVGSPATAKANGLTRKPTTAAQAVKASTATSTAPITKIKSVTAKPSGFFSSLQSASKKPGTSIKDRQSGQGALSKAVEVNATTASTAAPKAGFSFAETIANIGKVRDDKPVPKQEKVLPPESVEEKSKRLRKEARRQLHVSFKPNEELVEIRYFTHDPEEEADQNSSQVRDVGDVGGEGRMLKQHRDMMDVDEDDEAAEAEVQSLRTFTTPTPIDFSDVDAQSRKQNYEPFGGGESKVISAERAKREEYEANTLIVFYSDRNDIPPDPREPADPYNGEMSEPLMHFGTPKQEYADRARQNKTAQSYANRPQGVASNFDLSALTLFAQASQQPAMPHQPIPQSAANPITPDIQAILASLQQSAPAQAQQPPPPQAPPMMPWAHVQPPNMHGLPSASFSPANGPQVDLASILASIQQPPPSAAKPIGGFGAPNAAPMMGYAPQYTERNGTGETKRWRDRPGQSNSFFKTKVCKYWQEGRCLKGEDCTYLHHEPGSVN